MKTLVEAIMGVAIASIAVAFILFIILPLGLNLFEELFEVMNLYGQWLRENSNN